jgi:hypothetical protein
VWSTSQLIGRLRSRKQIIPVRRCVLRTPYHGGLEMPTAERISIGTWDTTKYASSVLPACASSPLRRDPSVVIMGFMMGRVVVVVGSETLRLGKLISNLPFRPALGRAQVSLSPLP